MKKYLTLKNLGWVLTALITLMLGMGGISKITGTEEMVNNFTFMNLLPYLTLIGILEVLGVLLLIYPKTSKYGAILLTCIMSGAVALHLSVMGGVGTVTPIVIGLVIWMAHCLRAYGSSCCTKTNNNIITEDNYRPLPKGLYIGNSPIEGNGLFTKEPLTSDIEFGITHIKNDSGDFHFDYIRTPLGGFVNHNSDNPNCTVYKCGSYLKMKTIKQIKKGDGLTLNYTLYKPCKDYIDDRK